MLCSNSKCYKEIEKGKEIQIKGSIICKDCFDKGTVGHCYTCSPKKMLYYKDKVYESSKGTNKSFGFWLFSSGDDSSETVIQCEKCYKDWKRRKTLLKKISKKINDNSILNLIFSLPIIVFALSILYFVYPEILKNFDNSPTWVKITFIVSSLTVLFFWTIISLLEDRYKTRERNQKEENK